MLRHTLNFLESLGHIILDFLKLLKFCLMSVPKFLVKFLDYALLGTILWIFILGAIFLVVENFGQSKE